jgi:phage tail sheath gpL-like
MAISFNQIPADGLLPAFYVEFDNTAASTGSNVVPHHALIIGQKLAAGSAPAGVIVPIVADGEADTYFGAGSQAAAMVRAYRSKTGRIQLSVLPIADAASGVACVKNVAFTGTATASGSVTIWIGGVRVSVGVAIGDLPAAIVSALVSAINAIGRVRFVASASGSALILTAKNKGTAGGEVAVSLNYQAEKLPAGITAAITTSTPGSVDPDFETLGIAGILGSRWFTQIAHGMTDTANVGYMAVELADRWAPQRQIGGVQFIGKAGDFATVQAWGAALNSPFTLGADAGSFMSPPDEIAAEYAATVAGAVNIDPARPTKTLDLPFTLAPVVDNRRSDEEAELLLRSGVATLYTDAGGVVRIQRSVTTYKTSPTGTTDRSYRNVETVYTLQAIGYDLKVLFGNKYPRHKLASDGANFGAGQPIITPKTAKAEIVARALVWENLGWIEGVDAFKKSMIVERNGSDPDRLDVKIMPDLVNQFLIAGVQIQFIL